MVWLVFAVFCIATAATALLLRTGLALRIAMDVPNDRSLHAVPTPRVGGLVLVGATLLGWAMLQRPPAEIVLPVLLLCAFSFIDDRRGLPVAARFGMHALAAVLLLYLAYPAVDRVMLAAMAVGLIWLTNLYNFMDGMDGLAGGMTLIGFAMLGAGALCGGAPELAAACFCVAAAAAGFLPFNWHPAKLFLGDAGSIPLGFLAGTLGARGWSDGLWPLWFPLLVFSPFVVDATATLLRRLLRGERIWQAHREHYYQRLVRMGWSHRRTALAEYAVMLVSGLLALALRDAAPLPQAGGLVAALVAYFILMAAIDGRWRSFAAERQGA